MNKLKEKFKKLKEYIMWNYTANKKNMSVNIFVFLCVVFFFVVIIANIATSFSTDDNNLTYANNEDDYLETQEQTIKETETNNIVEGLKDFKYTKPFFSYSGNGDDVVSNIKTENLSYAYIKNFNNGYFSVKGHYGGSYDLLVNSMAPYEGITLIMPNQEYTFEVSAKGDWTIDLYKLGTSSIDTFSGNSDYVTPIFLKSSNIYEIKTEGNGYFAIKGWGDNGYDLLVNTTDENYSGKVMFNNGEKYAFFEITGSRQWEINPVK